jgi:hypothetical protein
MGIAAAYCMRSTRRKKLATAAFAAAGCVCCGALELVGQQAAAALGDCVAAPVRAAVGRLVDVQIVDRVRNTALAEYAVLMPRSEKLGTGHGEREHSSIGRTAFERATSRPAEVVQVRCEGRVPPQLVESGRARDFEARVESTILAPAYR